MSDSLTQKDCSEIEYLSIIALRFCYETFFKEIKRYNDVSPPETLVLLLYSTIVYHLERN